MRSTMSMRLASAVAPALLITAHAAAQAVFSDLFDNGPSLLWGNERGLWIASGGVYFAQQPSNNPCTYSSIPYDFTSTQVECDVLATNDGGVWLRTNAAGNTGVLFVLAHQQAYWHTVTNGSFSGSLNAAPAFSTGQNLHLRLTVVGDTYRAYLNGSSTPITTLTTSAYPSGRVGLYDFTTGGHSYDNVVVSGDCVSGDCCPMLSSQPFPITICSTGTAVLSAQAAGSSLVHGWEYEVAPGEWYAIEEGPNFNGDSFLFNATGADTGTLMLDRGDQKWTTPYNVRASFTNGCGTVWSDPASISLCPADFDCSGFLDTDDYDAFVASFEAGTDDADFDGTGFVDTDDFTAFVLAFEAGC
ncbi:MAG: hypothetical protein L6Q35_07220 [Phycisphaerales bacterium]|nr:hypothetical protein [Phycisphaerales bacterium]